LELQDRLKLFETELNFIVDPQIRLFAEKAIGVLPDYFFEIPSSSTGKYHPNYALGQGGLSRHVKSAVRFAMECFRLDWYKDFTSEERDLIIVALLLHDGAKSGIPQQNYTQFEHPVIISKYLYAQKELQGIITQSQFSFITSGILSHMGAWNQNKQGKAIMPKPKTKAQKLIHWVDYVCSRKMFEVNFDAEISRV
jgi:hypothetical protein